MFEERLFQQQHAIRPLDALEAALESGDRALEIDGAGMPGPAGRHRIAPADHAAVVGEVQCVMIALPADFERRAHRLARLFATLCEGFVALDARDRNEPAQDVEKEEAHPDAGADTLAAEAVDAVVPIAGAEPR